MNKAFHLFYFTKILICTTAFDTDKNNNDNNNYYYYYYWASNQHIKIISEGSCDTEDWRNGAENSALPS